MLGTGPTDTQKDNTPLMRAFPLGVGGRTSFGIYYYIYF